MTDGESSPGAEEFLPLGGDAEGVYETVFRAVDDAVFLLDVDHDTDGYSFVFRRDNAAHREYTGISERELRGKTPHDVLDDEQACALVANYRQCVRQAAPIEYEETLSFTDDQSHWQTRLTPIFDGETVTQIVGVSRDVTARRNQERELDRLNRQFETVLDTMSAAAFLKSTDGRYLLMNTACRELFDVEAGEAVGLTDDDILPTETAQRARRDDRRVIEGGETIEIEEAVPTVTGETTRITRKSPVYDDDEVVAVCGVSTNITEQKSREREFERLAERFELAVQGANVGVWDWDLTTDDVEFNDQFARMLGYAPDEVDGELEWWRRRVHPDDFERVDGTLDDHLADETDYYNVEYRIQTADDDWQWLRTVGEVTERDEGEPVRAVGVHIDVDERVRYEETVERQRDDLETLNQIVRHDVRNAIQFVLAYGDMLSDHVDEEGSEYLERVLSGGREAAEITRTAGDVTEALLRSEVDHTPIRLWAVLESEIENVRQTEQNVVVTVDEVTRNVDVLADEMLESVFRNLLQNAVVHNDSDVAEIAVSVEADDDTVRTRIADDGPGVPDEQKATIFEQGERGTDSDGTGLGLYLVGTLVERYGGDVRVTDNEPTGSVFTVELPRPD